MIESHCPICATTYACQRFSKSELEIFQAVLGEDIYINRVKHIIAGARRCAYRIKRVGIAGNDTCQSGPEVATYFAA